MDRICRGRACPYPRKATARVAPTLDGQPQGLPLQNIFHQGLGIGDKTSWSKGYGSDAMKCVLEWLFREMNIHRVELETFATNERALKFFEHIGFKREGIKRQAHFADGRYYDIVCFGLLRNEFYHEKE